MPAHASTREPELVIGEPDTPSTPLGAVRPTLVTVPAPAGDAQAPSPRRYDDELHVPDQRPITLLDAAAVNALVPLPSAMPVRVPTPMPPWATVTSAFDVSNVALALGPVHVLRLVVGPANAKNPLLVPPLAPARMPLISAVSETLPKVGAPAAFPCNRVVVVPNEPTVPGAVPAPPPRTSALAVNAADVLKTDAELK